MIDVISDRYLYLFVIGLLSLGLFALFTERHLVKKLVVLIIFQTAVFLFFIAGGVLSVVGTKRLDHYAGLGHLMPWSMTGFTVAASVSSRRSWWAPVCWHWATSYSFWNLCGSAPLPTTSRSTPAMFVIHALQC